MDHLPQPGNPRDPIRIPYLHGPAYDNLGFFGFPRRVGMDPKVLVFRGSSGWYSVRSAAGFLQEWLWFGALCECLDACGIDLRREDFLQEGDNGETTSTFITTTRLQTYLDRFRGCLAQLDGDSRIEAHRKISPCLKEVQIYLIAFRGAEMLVNKSGDANSFLQSPLTPEIQLSVEALLTSLEELAVGSFPSSFPWAAHKNDRNCAFLVERAAAQGWCRSMASRIERVWGSMVLYYATLLRVPPSVDGNHKDCRGDMCIASDIKEDRIYPSLHDCVSRDCADFEPNQEEIAAAIDTGRIPLISLRIVSSTAEGGYDRIEHHICEYEPGLEYTAISHVWADGLGNPNKNAIPTCQLIALLNKLISVTGGPTQAWSGKPLYVWLDTFCVPVQSPTRRNAAIRSMSKIYRQATYVLALDSYLSQQPCPKTAVEVLMLILFSNWHQRLWTLQEAILGKGRLWIQFADTTVNFSVLGKVFRQEIGPVIYRDIIHLTAAHVFITYKTASEVAKIDDHDLFYVIALAVRTRSTSKASDEALCLASTLGRGLTAVLHAPDNSRMQALFLAIKETSKNIIFLSGQKLLHSGFRWAPASLLVPRSEPEIRDGLTIEPNGLASVSEGGLLGTFQGLMLSMMGGPIAETLWIRVPASGALYRLEIENPEEALKDMPSLAALSILFRIQTGSQEVNQALAGALLAECTQGINGVIAAKYVCIVRITLVDLGESLVSQTLQGQIEREAQQEGLEGVDKRDGKIHDTETTAQLTEPDQQWLIS